MQLPDFSKVNILVVGDIMLDRYWTGPTSRISPEAPVPVVNVQEIEDRPGGAANVALNLATLGCSVTLLGITGDDESANLLQEHLETLGIKCEFARIQSERTITKLRVMSRNQQLIRLDFEAPFGTSVSNRLIPEFEALVETHDLVLFSDYNKGTLTEIEPLLDITQRLNKISVVDPKGQDFTKYANSTLLTPNYSEFTEIVGACNSEEEIVDKAQTLLRDLSLSALLITRSEKGMTLIEADKPEQHFPAKAKEVYDVTGAGDTVIATLAASLAAKASTLDSCQIANAAAGIVVGKLGTSTVSVNELNSVLTHQPIPDLGEVNASQLKLALAQAKLRNEKIIMTNGCFDILHSGHVGYLEAARSLGDRLIVAVNSDASVTRLKGKGRPVNNLKRRMAVLAALSSVDWVISFDEDTPESLISELLPDVLVKGGDYKPEEIAGSTQVLENGGEVKVLGFEDGISTTNIISKLTT